MRVETLNFGDDGAIPNSALPVLVYRGALQRDAGPAAHEELFAGNGWLGAWQDGIFSFHHFQFLPPRWCSSRRARPLACAVVIMAGRMTLPDNSAAHPSLRGLPTSVGKNRGCLDLPSRRGVRWSGSTWVQPRHH